MLQIPTTSVQAAVAALLQAFREASLLTPELDARLLVQHACGLSHEEYILNPKRTLTNDEAERIAAFQARRLAREPVSRITGFREFWGRCFAIGPAVLDPRPDTETLVDAVLGLLRGEGRDDAALSILDLGTGSGCILLSLLAELPQAWGLGIDKDFTALGQARRNAAALRLAERVAFVQADWLDAIAGAFDVIVSNPPYIRTGDINGLEPEVSHHDPLSALDGGIDGLDAYRHITRNAARAVAPCGWMFLEAGAGQASAIIDLLARHGWTYPKQHCRIYRDLGGVDRVVAIMRQPA